MPLIELLLAWIHDPTLIIKAGGYLGIALAVFAESGVLIGLFLPGDSLLFAAGVLAGAEFLNIWFLVPVVVVAAILGDSAGYWFGHRVGKSLFKRPDSRFFKQEYIHRTEQFYERYGGRAVILARFVPIVRTLTPILAGVGSMSYRTFISYNVIGGVVWGAGVTLIGYFIGVLIPNSEEYLLPISLTIIAASFSPIVWHHLKSSKG